MTSQMHKQRRMSIVFKSLMAAFLFLPSLTFAQGAGLQDFFSNSNSPAVYLGVDFTQAKIINDMSDPQGFVSSTFQSINQLTIYEYKKYNFQEAFHKNSMENDLNGVNARNSKINAEALKSTNANDANRLKATDIPGVISGFNFDGKKGVGILFIVTGMQKGFGKGDKADDKLTAWVTLIDLATGKVLLTEQMEGKTGGFGERNFWAAGIKSILEEIQKHKYSEWKKTYSK
jgi:hypothetical protein